MKKTVAFLLLLAGAGCCMAQTTGSSLLPPSTDPKILAYHEWANQVIHAFGQKAVYRPAGINERVMAKSAYRHPDQSQLVDTTRYFYAASKGATYNFNSLDYSSDYNIMNSESHLVFNDDYVPDVKMDSLLSYDEALGLTSPYQRVNVVYTANGGILDYKIELYNNSGLGYGFHYINTYNAQGRLRESLKLTYIGTQWDSTSRKYFGYNAQGLLITDSFFTYNSNGWKPTHREQITYNTGNQVTKIDKEVWTVADSAWKDWGNHRLSYYSDGKLKALTTYNYMGTVLLPVYKDSLSYAPDCNFFLAREVSIVLSGTTLEPVTRYTRHLNAQQLPDTAIVLSKNAGGWILDRKYLLSYNASNNPIRKVSQNGDGDTLLTDHYYYEPYNDPTAVDVIARTKSISVYPNPAASELCMERESTMPGQRVSVALYNLAGQLAYSTDLHWREKVQCVNLTGLHPGLYHLAVTDAQGRLLHTQRIVKQ